METLGPDIEPGPPAAAGEDKDTSLDDLETYHGFVEPPGDDAEADSQGSESDTGDPDAESESG